MDLGPDDVAWLAETTGLPVVVKGVLRVDDAQALRGCRRRGRMDLEPRRTPARPIGCDHRSWPRCARSCPSGVQVYVDGGLRSGLHVMLAVALGADAAFVGRPMFYALAAGGEDGARRALDELSAELVESMRLAGCPTLADPGSCMYRRAQSRLACIRAVTEMSGVEQSQHVRWFAGPPTSLAVGEPTTTTASLSSAVVCGRPYAFDGPVSLDPDGPLPRSSVPCAALTASSRSWPRAPPRRCSRPTRSAAARHSPRNGTALSTSRRSSAPWSACSRAASRSTRLARLRPSQAASRSAAGRRTTESIACRPVSSR